MELCSGLTEGPAEQLRHVLVFEFQPSYSQDDPRGRCCGQVEVSGDNPNNGEGLPCAVTGEQPRERGRKRGVQAWSRRLGEPSPSAPGRCDLLAQILGDLGSQGASWRAGAAGGCAFFSCNPWIWGLSP